MLQEIENLEKLYKEFEIKDYASDADENGVFYWIQTDNNEWLPLATFLENKRRQNNVT
jgi:hypothetical protein